MYFEMHWYMPLFNKVISIFNMKRLIIFPPLTSVKYTLKRNRNATLNQWKIYWVLFKVIDGDNELSSFQEMHENSTKTVFEMIINKEEAHSYNDNVRICLC